MPAWCALSSSTLRRLGGRYYDHKKHKKLDGLSRFTNGLVYIQRETHHSRTEMKTHIEKISRLNMSGFGDDEHDNPSRFHLNPTYGL